jgi:hypothetical protein
MPAAEVDCWALRVKEIEGGLMKSRLTRRVAIGAAGVAGALCLALGGAVAAQAATGHSVSGAAYENGDWFKSSTVRTVGSSGTNIQLALTSVPSNGIDWRLYNAKNNSVFTGTTSYTSPATKTLVYDVLSGTEFQNDYKLITSGHAGSYSFAGTEIY